jgi:hypothetical protein
MMPLAVEALFLVEKVYFIGCRFVEKADGLTCPLGCGRKAEPKANNTKK